MHYNSKAILHAENINRLGIEKDPKFHIQKDNL